MTEIEGISYTVDANTAGLLKLEKQVATTTDSAVSDFKKLDKQVDTTAATVAKFAIELSKADKDLGRFVDTTGRVRESNGRFAQGLLASGESVAAFNQRMKQGAEGADTTGRKLNGVGSAAAQLGFQVQDAAVQLQSGASAFTVLAQQGSQAAAVMGPGGALFGAVLAVAAAIGGVLYNSIQKAKNATKELPEELQKQLEEIKKRYGEIDEASRGAFVQVEVGKLSTEYDKQNKVLQNLRGSLDTYVQEAGKGNRGAAAEVTRLTLAISAQEAKVRDLSRLQFAVSDQLAAANVNKDSAAPTDDGVKRAADLAAQIQAATLKLTEGELAARRFAAAQYLGLTNAEQLPPELDAALVKLVQLEEAQKRVNDQKRAELELQREIRSELDKELQAELAAMAAKDKDRKYIGDIMASGDGSQAARVAAEAEARIKMLQDIAARDTTQAEAAAEAIILVEQQKQDELTRIAAEAAEKRNQFTIQATQTTLGAFGDLFGNLADAAKEGGRDTFQQWKNLASAQAAISTALAFTNTLANPLIPYPLNLALAGSVAALGAVQIAKIQSQQYSGRLYGGPVQAGGMYPITEDGRPEILKQGSRQYLLPGTGGEVISNKDMQAGGGGGSITINYNPTIYAQDADFEAIMAGQPEAVLNAVRIGLASEGRTL